MLGAAAMIIQQLTGINLITYYAPYIIKSVGFSEHLSSLMSSFLNLFYYLSTLIPIFIINKISKRVLLLIGLLSMAMGMCILAGTTSVTAFGPGVAATVGLFWYDFCLSIARGNWQFTPADCKKQKTSLP
jgi:cyanate permease